MTKRSLDLQNETIDTSGDEALGKIDEQLKSNLLKLEIQRAQLKGLKIECQLKEHDLIRTKANTKKRPWVFGFLAAVTIFGYAIGFCLIIVPIFSDHVSEKLLALGHFYSIALGLTMIVPTVLVALLMRAIYSSRALSNKEPSIMEAHPSKLIEVLNQNS